MYGEADYSFIETWRNFFFPLHEYVCEHFQEAQSQNLNVPAGNLNLNL